MEPKESLDTKALRILFDYYTNNPGDAQMVITDLYGGLPDEDPRRIHAAILSLQKKDWVGCELTADGLTGLVWIAPTGIKVMSARLQSPPASAPKPVTQVATSQPPPVASPKPVAKTALSSETPLALIPGFQYDIFVSYMEEDRAWAEKTLANLRILMEFQRSCNKGERAPRLVGHAEWTPQARADAEASASFLIVFSQQYLASEWGKQADGGFFHALRQPTHHVRKIFVLTIDQTELPEYLCKANIYHFAREAADESDFQKYQSQLLQLGQDLFKKLQHLQKRAGDQKKLVNKGVLIDFNPVDQHMANNVTQRLNQFGITSVSPPIVSGNTPSEVKEYFEEQVLNSNGLLFIYGAAPQGWLIREVDRMRRIFANGQKQPPSAYAIYNGPPPADKLPEPFSFPGRIIDCHACQPNEQDCEQCPGKQAFLQFVEYLQKEEPDHA